MKELEAIGTKALRARVFSQSVAMAFEVNVDISRSADNSAFISEAEKYGYTDLMVDGAPSPHQSDTTLRWLIDRLRS